MYRSMLFGVSSIFLGEIMVCRFFKLFLVTTVVFVTSCTTGAPLPAQLQLPQPLAGPGPAIPFRAPNLLGEVAIVTPDATPTPAPEVALEPFTTLEQIQSCLAQGQTVYGIALQNSNVRETTELTACRTGRIERGSLVQITNIITVSNETTSTTRISSTTSSPTSEPATDRGPTLLPTSVPVVVQPEVTETTLGYVEDIQPIFQRTCIACHSGVVKQMNLQVTAYEPLMKGSSLGPVVIPGDPAGSTLWQAIDSGKMPLIGELPPEEKELVRRWIEQGALERQTVQVVATPVIEASVVVTAENPAATPVEVAPENNRETPGSSTASNPDDFWLQVADANVEAVSDICANPVAEPLQVVNQELILPVSCGVEPTASQLTTLLQSLALIDPPPASSASASATEPLTGTAAATAEAPVASSAAVTETAETAVAAPTESAPPASAPPARVASAPAGIQAALNLPAPSDGDGWLTPQGGFCLDQHLADNERGITAIAFAPDGRLFMALDTSLDGQQDTNILYDAYHPSRSIAIYDPVSRYRADEILRESSRITGLAYSNGALFVSRAGEVGWIPDGGSYRPLAGGFAVNSQLFHANNGVVISNGYLYISAGGVRDGYSDGPLVGISEGGAQDLVSGGNRFAARLLRAPLSRLLNEYSIEVFETAARGLRNPYGVAVDPSGRIWFTDNGATNVPENVSAGDEVNVFDPNGTPAGTPEGSTPYYGFPLALTSPQDWYSPPVVDLYNTSAPTGITWAYGTVFFAQYGRNPGLYRVGRAGDGRMVAERIMLVWPLLSTATAPDGALWIGTGSGGLYRMTPGC